MATHARTVTVAGTAEEQAGELRYVARQPILDQHGAAQGYELLFWNGRGPSTGTNSDLATRTMLDNTVIFGLEELARGLPVFVNCTADSLTEEWVEVLPPHMTVLELASDAEPTPSLLAACRKLKSTSPEFRIIGPWSIWPTISRWISTKSALWRAGICFAG
jgi:EAL and modified HD-GYP domain-containing signal transduction protein